MSKTHNTCSHHFIPTRHYDILDLRMVAIGNLKATIAMVAEAEAQAARDTLLALAEDIEGVYPDLAAQLIEAAR
jgi:hypothetical protein